MAEPIRSDRELLGLLDRGEFSSLTPAEEQRLLAIKKISQEPSWLKQTAEWLTETASLERINRLLEPLAHPEDLSDIAGLLIPSLGGVPTRTAKAAINATRTAGGETLGATGRAVERAGTLANKPNRWYSVGGMYNYPKSVALITMGPPALQRVGRLLQWAGRGIAPGEKAVTAAAVVSDADKAALIQRYGAKAAQGMIDKLERNAAVTAQAGAPHAPLPSKPTSPPLASPVELGDQAATDAMRARIQQRITERAAPPSGPLPRRAGKAPTLNEVLTDTLNELRTQPGQPGPAGRFADVPAGPPFAERLTDVAAGGEVTPRFTDVSVHPPSRFTEVSAGAPASRAKLTVEQAKAMIELKPTPDELTVIMEYVNQGHSLDQIVRALKQIRASEALRASESFSGLPSASETTSDVIGRNATGRWGKGPTKP